MQEPMPDPRIAVYIAEVSQPGIPYISSSHLTLFRLGVEHGQKLVQDLIDQYFAAKRHYDGVVG